MKRHAPTILAVMVAASLTLAGPIHTWVTGEVITSSDLNANFSHIHNTMVGGHGPRLMNSDVSSGAAISHSKLATPALLPKAWIQADCTTTPSSCSALSGSLVDSVTWNSTGRSTVNLTAARPNSIYGTVVSAAGSSVAAQCLTYGQSTTTVTVNCTRSNPDGGLTDAQVDSNYSLILMDDNN